MVVNALCAPLALGSSGSVLLAIVLVLVDIVVEFMALWNVAGQGLVLFGNTVLSHEEYVIACSTPLVSRALHGMHLLPPLDITPELISTFETQWLLIFLACEQGDLGVQRC